MKSWPASASGPHGSKFLVLLVCLGSVWATEMAAAEAGLASAFSPATSAVAAPSEAPRPLDLRRGTSRTVTLITGDRVTVTTAGRGPDVVTVDDRTDVRIRREGSTIEVVPTSLAHLVPDMLDPRLFDVTGLIAMGYDDEGRDDIPLILQLSRGSGLRSSPGVTVDGPLRSVRSEAVTLEKSQARRWTDEVFGPATGAGDRSNVGGLDGLDRVWLDATVRASAAGGPVAPSPATTGNVASREGVHPYLEQIGIGAASAAGLDGTGTSVAVLDTGVDLGHPVFDGVAVTSKDFTSDGVVTDVQGHGTHVASLIVGNGFGSGEGTGGLLRGVASAAQLLNARVLTADGTGQESWLIAGMEWAVAEGADVANLSLGTPALEADDPLTLAVDRLSASSDTLFVVAAGNSGTFGPDPFTIDSPATAAAALAVSSVNPDGLPSVFASEGPTRGNYRAKPDIAAPGEAIPGALAGARSGDETLYAAYSGTSQASPLVAGTAALLAQQHPQWGGETLRRVLLSTAAPLNEPGGYATGSGRVAVDRAIRPQVLLTQGDLDFGLLAQDDQAPETREVRVDNATDTTLDLDVTVDAVDAFLKTAPVGFAVTDTTSMTIAPGGSRVIEVTVDPERSIDGTFWRGRVRLSDTRGPLLDIPLTASDEPELYEVNLTVIGRDGQAPPPMDVPMQELTRGGFVSVRVDDGRGTALLPPGRWSAIARIPGTDATGHRTLTIAGDNDIEIRQDLDIRIDARRARPVKPPKIGGRTTTATVFSMTYESLTADSTGYTELVAPPVRDVIAGRLFVQTMPAAAVGRSMSGVRWQLRPDAPPVRRNGPRNVVRAVDQPDTYELHWRRLASRPS